MSLDVQARLDRFTPRDLRIDLDRLSPDLGRALPHLVEAMRGMDRLYHRQLGTQVVAVMADLDPADVSPRARALRHFNGPYDRLDGDVAFVEGVDRPLPGKALYPADLTEAELDAWLTAHPENKAAFLSPTTVIVRDGDGLAARPYGEVFRDELEAVAAELRAAAGMIEHRGLAAFLEGRARALLGQLDRNASDAEWVRLTDAPLEVVIGPFEVYGDELKGAKAFYEGMLLAVDHEAGARLASIEAHVGELAALVPLPDGSRGAGGGIAPMVIADEIIATGDGYAGILASAFNLPNDAGVRAEVGWKQIMVRNVMQAKFEACTAPIARRVLTPAQVDHASFDAYFYFVLLHEVSHSLGPVYRADGRTTNEACGKYYSALEEAKADTGALVLLLARNGQYGIPAFTPLQIGASYLAGTYRSARFGLHEAHGRANVVQYSFLLRQGALSTDPATGRLQVQPERLQEAAQALLETLTRLQASGTEADMAAFLAEYGTPPASLVEAIEGLRDLPVDIIPTWPV